LNEPAQTWHETRLGTDRRQEDRQHGHGRCRPMGTGGRRRNWVDQATPSSQDRGKRHRQM